MLALALLVVRSIDGVSDGVVRSWCDAVVEDSPSYADGEVWRAPNSWRAGRRNVPAAFKTLVLETTLPQRRGIMFVLARHGKLNDPPPEPETELKNYLHLLFHEDKTKCLLGAGNEQSIKRGAVRRSTYLQPRVARLVRAQSAELQSLLEEGITMAVDDKGDGDDVPGKVGGSAKKSALKRKLVEAEQDCALRDEQLRREVRAAPLRRACAAPGFIVVESSRALAGVRRVRRCRRRPRPLGASPRRAVVLGLAASHALTNVSPAEGSDTV